MSGATHRELPSRPAELPAVPEEGYRLARRRQLRRPHKKVTIPLKGTGEVSDVTVIYQEPTIA